MKKVASPSIGANRAAAGGAAPASGPGQALRDHQQLLQSLLDNLPLGVGVYDHDGSLLHSNQRLSDFTGLSRLPSADRQSARQWRGMDAEGRPIGRAQYPGARALRGEMVTPGVDFIYDKEGDRQRWVRVSAVPFRREGSDANQAIVVVQDVDDLKRTAERAESAGRALARQTRFLETTLSSIPDFVYAFDHQRRFVYANPAMLGLFGLTEDEMVGKTFAELDYSERLAARLNEHIDRIFTDGRTVEDEVFFRTSAGHAGFYSFVWGPVRGEDGSVELVVGVSRETTERRAMEEELRRNEARLRAATELAGLAIYSWDPQSGALDWDERLRAMWGLTPEAKVDQEVFEQGIHPDDLPRVRTAIEQCVDPSGTGQYNIEYRVIGHTDGVVRHIATSGRTTFADGQAVSFIGAALDVTSQRLNEAAIRAKEAQFRSFAEHSSNLIWIADTGSNEIIFRSAAFERIWGIPCADAATAVSDWMQTVHPDDQRQVAHSLELVKGGEVTQYEYRIVRPADKSVRWLRDTSFPIPNDAGAITRIGGITEDLTRDDANFVYVLSAKSAQARKLAGLIRELGFQVRPFNNVGAFLNMAPVLAPGCVLVDIRSAREQAFSVPRELKARAVMLPAVALDSPEVKVGDAVAAMKAGFVDHLVVADELELKTQLATMIAECHAALRPTVRDETAGARIARLTPREHEVLVGLVGGGTNKTIAKELGISPRTVELHRAQVMNRLDASSLTELLQVALAAGIAPPRSRGLQQRENT